MVINLDSLDSVSMYKDRFLDCMVLLKLPLMFVYIHVPSVDITTTGNRKTGKNRKRICISDCIPYLVTHHIKKKKK
jgi:hypothetical protein